jgi:hypothetical protein
MTSMATCIPIEGWFIALSALGKPAGMRGGIMEYSKEVPFEKTRRVSKKELNVARKAIELKTGKSRPPRGRPAR